MLSGLGKRIFLMNNVNKSAPDVFEARWALSYLRGPLTRDQIRTLMAPVKSAIPQQPAAAEPAPATIRPAAPAASAARVAAATLADSSAASAARPMLPPTISQYFLPPAGKGRALPAYTPMVYAAADMYFSNAKVGVDVQREVAFLCSADRWASAVWIGTMLRLPM